MTITARTIHPNGTRFECVAPFYAVYSNLTGWVKVRNPKGQRGVNIISPEGKKVFKTDKDYEHIMPLEPNFDDIFQ